MTDPDQEYGDWYVWAKRNLSGQSSVCHAAAAAATEVIAAGGTREEAIEAARRSFSSGAHAVAEPTDLRRRTYAEWFDWARRELGGVREQQHAAAAAALRTLEAGQGANVAMANARAAAGMAEPGRPVMPSPPPAAAGPWPGAPPPSPAAPPAAAPPAAPPAAGPPGYGPPAYPPATPPAPAAGPPAYPPPQSPPYAPPAGPPYGPSAYPPAVPQAPWYGPPAAAPAAAYAGFWRRLLAVVIDLVLWAMAFVVVVFGIGFAIGLYLAARGASNLETSAIANQLALPLDFLGLVLAWLYFTLAEALWQGTVGKLLLGIKVTGEDGRRISWWRANARYWAKLLSFLILGVGFLMAAFTDRKQALHDIVARTLVVRRHP